MKSINYLKLIIPNPVRRLAIKWVDRIRFQQGIRRATPVLVYQIKACDILEKVKRGRAKLDNIQSA